MAEQQQAVNSADTQIFAAKEAAADRRESSPPTSELSVGKMNPQVVTVEQEGKVGVKNTRSCRCKCQTLGGTSQSIGRATTIPFHQTLVRWCIGHGTSIYI